VLYIFMGKNSNTLPSNVVENNLPQENQVINNNQTANINTESDCDAPWIKVLSPNGGEIFNASDTATIKIPIRWASCNIKTNNVAVGIENINTGVEEFPMIVPDNGTTNLDYINYSQGNYKIIICNTKMAPSMAHAAEYEKDCSVSDTSDNFFTINSNNNLRKEGETCGENIGTCMAGLVCDYPCGIQGCQNVCMQKGHPPIP